MAYVENPIVEGKDFEATANDVNGNFSELRNETGVWEKIGEIRISGLPPVGFPDIVKSLGNPCGSIGCDGKLYEKIYLTVKGTLPSTVKLKTAMSAKYEGYDYYPDFITSDSVYFNRGGSSFCILRNQGYNDLPSENISNQFDFYWLYGNWEEPEEVDVIVKLYGLRKPQWLLDALEIT
jgi:hypothetical protein